MIVGLGVASYAVLFGARTISAYTSGTTLFDLATYAQGFANALGDVPFFYSLEGEMSRFGRHFSPFFYLLLPLYWLHPDPATLLALQAVALGLGAVPLYWLAARRLGKPVGAAFAWTYLASPAVHDVNLQNDFHEIAFSLPLLLLAFHLGLHGRVPVYLVALLLALATREEVAMTTAALGLYLATFGRRRILGAATLAISLAWLIVATAWVMPALNAHAQFPMPEGYAYLGSSPAGVAEGALTRPDLLLREVARRAKAAYAFWLVAPLGLLPLLAPEALAVSGPALLEVLASTSPPHYRIFERYAAPILPGVFLAAVFGAARLRRLLPPGPVWSLALALLLLTSTAASQAVLRKLPTEIQFSPSAHAASGLGIAAALPRSASVAVADHRLLARLANRHWLYGLTPTSPRVDYVIFDRKGQPITNVSPADLRHAEERYLRDSAYSTLRCEDGIFLLGRREAIERDGPILAEDSAEDSVGTTTLASFGDAIALAGIKLESADRPPGVLSAEVTWRTTGRPGADFQVFVHLVDAAGQLRAQHDGAPQDGYCPTSTWTPGLVVRDRHVIALPPDLPPGTHEVRIGLYELSTLRRLPRSESIAASGSRPALDYYAQPVQVGR